jgi:hypothetical protein
MKKFQLLALALVIGVTSVFATPVESSKDFKTALRNEIVKLLQSPEFVLTEEINVTLKFTFSSEGEIVILCPGCENKEVVKYIRENLNYKKFKTPGEQDKIYTIPLKLAPVI